MVRFGVFELDPEALELRKRGVKVKLQDQPLKVLQLLLERPGQVVTRDDLRAGVWPGGTFVEFDQGLYTAIARLRGALGDSAESPLFVETVARHGYRFIAPLMEGPGPPEEPGRALAAPRSGKRLRRYAVGGLAGLAGAALLLGGLLGFRVERAREWLQQRALLPVRSLAVLPLANLSGDPEQDYFAEGVSDRLTADLARLGDLRVVSRTSLQRYKDTGRSLSQMGRELGLDAVIEGTVERTGSAVRLRLQLTGVPAGRELWADTYDGELKDIPLLQSEAARDIARALGLTTRQQQRLAAARQVDLEAYEACLKGFYFSNKRSPLHFERAIEHFQRAIERDPGYALAYAGLSEALVGQLYAGTPSETLRARATGAALKAVEIDPSSPEAHNSLAVVREVFDWNWPGAEREYRTALELNPNLAAAHQEYAVFLGAQGRFDQAISEAQRSQDLDPVSPFVRTTFCLVLTFARRYDSAIEKCREALELDPGFPNAHWNLVRIYDTLGMGQEAVAEFEKAAATRGVSATQIAAVKERFARRGMEGFRRARLDLTLSQPATSVDAFGVAELYSLLGDGSRSLDWLEKAVAERSPYLEVLKVAASLDGVRTNPRFEDFLRRLGL